MSSAMAPARSFPPQKFYEGDHTNGAQSAQRQAPVAWHRGPTKGYNRQINKKASKAKSGRPSRARRNDDDPKHDVLLLHRLSLPFSSNPSGTLLERIGGKVEDEVASILADWDRIDGERMSEGSDYYPPNMSFSTTPHCYTPEPGEVERFLESVIGAPPPPPSPSPPRDMHACMGNKPTLALETHNLPVDHLAKVQDPSSSVLYSPTQTAVNSLSSANPTLDHSQQSPLLGDTMPPLSPSTLEECRKLLVPVFLASARARDSATRLDSEQCLGLLSDYHCQMFLRQAKEMRLQLSSLVSQQMPMYQGWGGSSSLKRDRADDADGWLKRTRSRFSSVNTVVSDASRRDSDITLVDFPAGKLPPKAPRAMLLASQGKALKDAQNEAPEVAFLASPTTEDCPPSSATLIELVHQIVKMFPVLVPQSQAVSETDASSVPVGTLTGDQSNGDVPEASLPRAVPSSTTDFVSHLPTQPGIWFKQQGRQYAEIVDIDIDVSDDMFYMSQDCVPFGLRVHLRLCSVPVPVNAVTDCDHGDTPTSLQDIDGVIERHALHWPKKGKLVVQVNPESRRSKTWLPYTLGTDPLDVTSCMQPGKNTFRFIQLSDLSGFTFVLAASPPLPEDEWRSWDWSSLIQPRPSPSDDDSMNDLSDFTRIPVTVRS